MQSKLMEITYDVELRPGETLSLPEDVAEILGPGHWLVSIKPANQSSGNGSIRNHSAFLNSYTKEDEGLYDDYSAR